MTTRTQQHHTQAATPSRRLAALRGNCMGAAVLLIIQFAVGTAVNLYVTLPDHEAFFSTLFGSALLAAHVIVALVLLGAAISALPGPSAPAGPSSPPPSAWRQSWPP